MALSLLLALCLTTSSTTGHSEADWKQTLDARVLHLGRSFTGEIALYAKDKASGIEYRYRADQPVYLASGVKVPFMIEVYRQLEQGKLSLDEELVYTKDDVRDGSSVLHRVKPGARLKIRELLRLMIQHSDNAASDLLVKRVGIENINSGLEALGIKGFTRLTSLIDVRRGVFRELDPAADALTPAQIAKIRRTWGWHAHVRALEAALGKTKNTYSPEDLYRAYGRYYASGLNNATTEAVGTLMERMLDGTVVSERASAEMIKLMQGSRTSANRILGRLPKGTKVAHKTGSQWERICDFGIIDLPSKRSLVFASCLAGGGDRARAEKVLADLARTAYNLALRTRS